jgi:hypothetical protein
VHHAVLGTVEQRQALGPRRGDIGQGERIQEGPVGSPAAVGDQVTFEKAWLDIRPLGKRAYGNLLLEQPAWFGRAQPVRLTQWAQQPIHRGCAEGQQLFTDLIGDDQVAVALQGGDELR